ncbi:MAG: PilZ domain-containing protein [Firmicutes bacterium]|nr:PilZ domain-containing protein [Bacillota bacterium]
MPIEERRASPRVTLPLPLKLRRLDQPGAPVRDAEVVNLSERGLLFLLEPPLAEGTPFEMSLVMPGSVTGGVPMRVSCTARVLRVEPQRMRGLSANAALIERYDTIVAEG